MDYQLRALNAAEVLGPDPDPEHLDPRVEQWMQAVAMGFLDARIRGAGLRVWAEGMVRDEMVLRGVYLDEVPTGALGPDMPVATFTSFDKTLNTGAGQLLDLHMITDVTVRPSHRRRGLLRQMMTTDLREAKDRGLSMAALTVSEGSIYGRFGFGAATWCRHIALDTSRRFALRDEASGRVEMVDPHGHADLFSDVFRRFHATTRGSVDRPNHYRDLSAGTFDDDMLDVDHARRGAVHHDPSGEVDGYVSYRVERTDRSRELKVHDLVATSSDAYLGLWQFLASVDLVERVSFRRAPMEDPLEFALADPRLYSVTRLEDLIWLRVLDPVGALEGREWSGSGSCVLELRDPLGLAGGRWALDVADGRASVEASTAPADVTLDVDTLASLYLGGVTAPTLARAGRLEGSPDALRTFAELVHLPSRPYSITGF
ncbi:GNAT family N-acetyltransferase [Desertihabitans brevis]|uniref:GNAT family N-acetyltransferase n=1 Tax=Desertihabitans brevis TaxID=2268447 RepID=A0A367YRP1_9ACTN|nr:GNAT family N-acetyltransferase [Desertihabitans brevis]RCK68460.1 GNAT family N-acetyltransferase [Desertihabitans brevis]